MAPARSLRDRRFASRTLLIQVALALGLGCVAIGPGGDRARAEPRSAGEQAYARADYVRAARLLLPEAQDGSAMAQTYLGYMYANGLGVPQDFAAAAKWLTLGAERDVPTAQYLLGSLYDRGQGVKHDFVMAEIWLDLAAAHAEPSNRASWEGMRDAVAGKLTRAELAEAQRRAAAWTSPGAP
jgi:TPR repeat protein